MSAMLRFVSRPSSSSSVLASPFLRQSTRSIHLLPPIPYSVSNGCPPLFSKEGFDVVALEYQQGLLDRLNDTVRSTPEEAMTVLETIMSTAGDPSKALAFNYASAALNNSFFLSGLGDPANPPLENDPMVGLTQLKTHLEGSFGSLAAFRSSIVATARGMSGSGWLWIVQEEGGTDFKDRIAIVTSYASGTILVRGRNQIGRDVGITKSGQVWGEGVDLAELASTGGEKSEGESTPKSTETGYTPPTPRPSYAASQFSAGSALTPLAVCSIHEHAWMKDYGVWGKEQYVENWIDTLDWARVQERMAGPRHRHL